MNKLLIGTLNALIAVLAALSIAGGVLVGAVANGPVGAVLGLLGAVLLSAVVFGTIAILLEIHEHLAAIRRALEAATGHAPPGLVVPVQSESEAIATLAADASARPSRAFWLVVAVLVAMAIAVALSSCALLTSC